MTTSGILQPVPQSKFLLTFCHTPDNPIAEMHILTQQVSRVTVDLVGKTLTIDIRDDVGGETMRAFQHFYGDSVNRNWFYANIDINTEGSVPVEVSYRIKKIREHAFLHTYEKSTPLEHRLVIEFDQFRAPIAVKTE